MKPTTFPCCIGNANDGHNHDCPMMADPQFYAAQEQAKRIADLEAKLAASQAREKQMREALLDTARRVEALKKPCGFDPETPTAIENGRYASIVLLAHQALALPTDDTALREYVVKELESMANVIGDMTPESTAWSLRRRTEEIRSGK